MSYLLHYNAARDLSTAPASGTPSVAVPAESSKTLAGVLSASVLAALLVVADQLIDSWADGHLLLAWVLLWSAVFTVLALLTQPLRRMSTAAALWLMGHMQAAAQARREKALWEHACQDPRVMDELRAAFARAD
jgi:hypothetical protein